MILVNVQQILQSLKKHVTFVMIVYIVKFVQLKTFVKHVMILLKLIMELVLVLPLQLFSIVLVLLVIFPIVICLFNLPRLAEEQLLEMYEAADWDKADANNDTKLSFPEFKVFQKASE